MSRPLAGRRSGNGRDAELVIGLLNNMPPEAMRPTETQIVRLLEASAAGRDVRLEVYAAQTPQARAVDTLSGTTDYRPVDSLWGRRLDGLIVTGMEPKARAMEDEPLWPLLRTVVDWASHGTLSTIWSCMAAHGAVYRLDRIRRQPLPRKLFGVFEFAKASNHSLVAALPPRWKVPHSRYNGLNDRDLRDEGYTILSYSGQGGADAFIRQEGESLFVFLQGHPEYGPTTLLREYRRDVRRFLSGESGTYPEVPENYFDDQTTQGLWNYRQRWGRRPTINDAPDIDTVLTEPLSHDWLSSAVGLYSGWLSYLSARKAACAVQAGFGSRDRAATI